MYQAIRNAVNDDMDAVDHYIVEQLHSQVPLIENIGHYIVDAGGKRLRPILVLLAARCCGSETVRYCSRLCHRIYPYSDSAPRRRSRYVVTAARQTHG